MMKWIARRPKLSAVTIAVIVLFVVIFASGLLSRQDNAAGRAAGAVLAAIQKPFVLGLDLLGGRISAAFTDEALREENAALKAEVESLEEELVKNRLGEAELEELRQLRDALGPAAPEGYGLRAAGILAFEGSNIFNIFTIDVGVEAGAGRDTVVIAGGGLVGRVLEANANSSKVAAIIDESNRVGFVIEGRPSELGVCYGDGNGGLAGEMLGGQADVNAGEMLGGQAGVHVGDRVMTSGLGGIYPAGILIGTVTKAEFSKEGPLLHVEIETAVDFKGLRKVALLL